MTKIKTMKMEDRCLRCDGAGVVYIQGGDNPGWDNCPACESSGVKKPGEMSMKDILNELATESKLNRARRILSGHCGQVDQMCRQRRSPSPVDIRRLEFEAVKKILKLWDIEP